MSDVFAALIAQARGAAPAVRPRPRSVFEAPGPAMLVEQVEAVEAPPAAPLPAAPRAAMPAAVENPFEPALTPPGVPPMPAEARGDGPPAVPAAIATAPPPVIPTVAPPPPVPAPPSGRSGRRTARGR